MKKKLYLVDVSTIFFRAFFAIRELTSPKGMPVNAIYGFLSMMAKLMKEKQPQYMAFCYDRREPTFRSDIDPNYKAHREAMPEELAVQIPYIRKFAGLLGVPEFEANRFEADDCIGTLATWASQQGFDVVIVSGDKDFAQLISPSVVMYDTMKEVVYDELQVFEKWGVRPDQFIDYLSLIGDSSDNVPGIAGIGPKTAEKLLKEYDTLENIFANVAKITAKALKAKIETGQDAAFMSRKLVTICQDVPIEMSEELLRLRPMQRETLNEMMEELNFKVLQKQFLGLEPGAAPSRAAAAASPEVTDKTASLATPTVSVSAAEPAVRKLSFSDLAKELPENSEVWLWEERGSLFVSKGLEILETPVSEIQPDIFESHKWRLNGYDLKLLAHRLDLKVLRPLHDVMLLAYVDHAEAIRSLEQIAAKYLQLTPQEFLSPGRKLQVLQQLNDQLREKLSSVGVFAVYNDIERPLVGVLYQMERKGVLLDTDLLKEQSRSLHDDLREIEKEIYQLAGDTTFNILSPKQLGQILFEKLQLPTQKKTKTGFSTDNDVLESISHPIAKKVLQYRELAKLKSTYVDALPALIHPQDGRVHTSFNQAWTATGRLSSENPNLQNIPVRTERGQEIRQAFIASPGEELLSLDYSQIELRILAHISKDESLVEAFQRNADVHSATASLVFNKPQADVNAEDRRIAKAVNFGIAYGQGAFGLAEALGIERKKAQEIIVQYFSRFPGIKRYIDETIQQAHEKGFVETMFGRRRYLSELKSKNPALKKFGERAAINAPMQGTAADIVKLAMIRVAEKVDLPMTLQVHDELLFEGESSKLNEATPAITDAMENVVSLSVPLKVNSGQGKSWYTAH